MTQQIYTTPTPFSGTNISIPNSGKGYTSNMVIKGQTYQNLVDFSQGYTIVGNKDYITVANNKISFASISDGGNVRKILTLLKPNTLYTICTNVYTLPSKDDIPIRINDYDFNTADSTYQLNIFRSKITKTGLYKDTFTTSDKPCTLVFYASVNNVNFSCSFPIILEGDWTNKEVPNYITGIKSVGEKENNKISILSHNKNLIIPALTEKEMFYGYSNGTISYTKDFDSFCAIIDSNTQYNVSPISAGISNFTFWTKDGEFISGIPTDDTFTSPQNAHFLKFAVDKNINNAQVEKGQSSTDYVAPKEDKTQILLPIEGGLKSLPNGVADTIEQREDGVYLVQKVGKYVLNGSENWGKSGMDWSNTDGWIFYHTNEQLIKKGGSSICDKLPTISSEATSDQRSNTEGITVNKVVGEFRMFKKGVTSVQELQTWLQTNPLTVYYELATAIETKLDIDNINLQTFKDLTYVISDNSIEPILGFKAPILGYKTINPIQLKTTQDGTEVNVYPYSTPELITFGDNETLADKMNNIENTHKHNNATVTSDGFMSKESYAKLESLTNYTHPSTHAATMITEDSTHRFITDTERNNWNAKASTNIATSSTNGLMSNTDKQKIDRISNNFDIVYDANTETIRFRFR